MANITKHNYFAYTTDTLSAGLSGLALADGGRALDLSNADEVTGITATVSEPAGTDIHFMFNAGSGWFSLSEQGYAQIVSTETPDAEFVRANGNTAAELRALASVPAFAGETVQTAVSLYAEDEGTVPEVSAFAVKYKVSGTLLTYEIVSPEYDLGNDSIAVSAVPVSSATGNGTAEIEARIKRTDMQWGDWEPAGNISMYEARAVQFRAVLSVASAGGGTASVNSVECLYTSRSSGALSSYDKTIYTNTENWYIDIKQCRMTLKHQPLETGSTIKPYISFRGKTQSVKNANIGTGTGERAQYDLPQKDGISFESIKIYYDNARVYTGWEANTMTGKITASAPAGAVITASYEYGYDLEEWHEMTQSSSWELPAYDQTEYFYALPEGEEAKGICALKIELHAASGTASKENLGKGTGKTASYQLGHKVRDGKITVYSNNTALAANRYKLLADGRMIQASAPSGQTVTATYNWVSEPPVISQITAVFS